MMKFLLLLSIFLSACFGIIASTTSQSDIDENYTVLQKHVSFFDRNKDGIIYPKETFSGFRAIGCNVILSTFSATFIHGGLSSKTRPGEPVDLKLPIVIKNIHMAKHGSDSGVYDEAGRFVPSKFDEIFAKHSSSGTSLTSDELKSMIKGNRVPKDYVGWLASYTEWKILYDLGKDKNGLLQKDTVRSVYDGSFFEQLAKKKAQSN